MLKLLLLAIGLYIGLGLALYLFQRSFIYYPVSHSLAKGLAEVSLDANEYMLQGLVGNSGKKTVVFYFGGNAEQIAYSVAEMAQRLPSLTFTSFYYRGYGGSQGEPSEKALFADALSIYDRLAKEYDRVIVMGRSLGSGVAVHLAANRKVDRLVLITPFDSIANIAAKIYWYYPVKWMLRDKFESLKLAPKVRSEVLILTAALDTTVPLNNSSNLEKHFSPGLVQSQLFKSVGHNNIEMADNYYATIARFLSVDYTPQ